MKVFFVLLLLATLAFAQDILVIFSDSPDGDILYDSSWGYRKSPSSLELAGGNDKFPVETGNVFYGAHSLRLNWQSNSGGDWGVAVAAPGWTAMDFTQYDSLVYWLNAEELISKEDLPDIALEDTGNRKTGRLALGDYLPGIDDDPTSWQKAAIPISDFSASGANLQKIKTLFHFQKRADGEQHTAFIDEVRVVTANGGNIAAPERPSGVRAIGYDSRIDLNWQAVPSDDEVNYFVYGADNADGPFQRLTKTAHEPTWFSDFFGENNKARYYYVTAVNIDFVQSAPSDTVTATSFEMNEEELLTSVQEAAFRYFFDYGHPVSGLTRERKGSGNTCTSGGTGFGLMNFPIAVERGFVGREDAAQRVLKICTFFRDKAERHYGAWSHWINGETGTIIPFSTFDDGPDLVETAYVVQGLLTVRQFFDANNDVESQIRNIATQLWREVDWSWFRKETQENVLYWHWSPNYGWQMNHPIRGFNETMITYILAIASPTHAVPTSLYDTGWAGSNYSLNASYYDILQPVGPPKGGPLFFTHYSFLGLNPHEFTDDYCNYYENNRAISLIHHAYALDNPKNCASYSELDWGLTASDDYNGYSAHSPTNDNCTITPTAAISAMPYTPEQSLATLKHFYFDYGPRLWGEFGFKDAFSIEEDWFAESVLAIDQGTIGPMIENYRTGLIWDLFMANEEISAAIKAITSVEQHKSGQLREFRLEQNYPNPFNPETHIKFSLPNSSAVTLSVTNILGKETVRLFDNEFLSSGRHVATFNASNLAGGLYFLTLKADAFQQTRKMIVIK